MSEIKVYGLDSGLIHDAAPKDGFVVDVVRFNDYVELEKKYQALVGENAVMLNLLTEISENHSEFVDESDDYMYASIPLDYVSEINTYVSRDVDAENPFIATDKALNEIKARGVDEFTAKIARDLRMAGGGHGYHEEPYHEFADHIECKGGDFAASLRGNN